MNKVRLRHTLLAVAVPTMFLAALVAWAFASPVGASPDDDYHMASIWCSDGVDGELCQQGSEPSERLVAEVLLKSSDCYAFSPATSASCSSTLGNDLVSSDRGNFIGSYPPVFYTTMSVFAGSDVSLSLILMRSFNALLFVGVATGLFFVLRREQRAPLLWGAIVTLVPLGMFLIPSVNPSSWAVLAAATLWVALVGYFSAASIGTRAIFAAIAGLVTVMGAGARSDSAVYSVIAMVAAVILTAERTKNYLRLAVLPLCLAGLAGVFFLSSGQSAVVDPSTAPTELTAAETVGLTISNLLELPSLWAGTLGTWGLGWVDTAMPASVWVSTLAVFFAFAFWGLQKVGARKGAVLAIVFASLVMVPLYILVKDAVMVGVAVQPRYVYPLIILFSGLVLLKLGGLNLGLSRLQLAIVSILLSIANSVALHTNIRRYVTGTDVTSPNLNSDIEWWWAMPLSPMTVWGLGSAAFAAAMLGVYLYTRPDTASTRMLQELAPATVRSTPGDVDRS